MSSQIFFFFETFPKQLKSIILSVYFMSKISAWNIGILELSRWILTYRNRWLVLQTLWEWFSQSYPCQQKIDLMKFPLYTRNWKPCWCWLQHKMYKQRPHFNVSFAENNWRPFKNIKNIFPKSISLWNLFAKFVWQNLRQKPIWIGIPLPLNEF